MRYHLYRRPNKKTGAFWMDLRVNDCRYREPLGTTDRSEAHELMLKRIDHLKTKAPDPAKRGKSYGSMNVETGTKAYVQQRRAQVSPRMCAYWNDQSKPLAKHFGDLKLKNLTLEHINDYHSARLDQGKAPKTINGEVSVLRQLLKHAKLWYRFEDYKSIRNTKPPVGRALTAEEQQRLFEVAQSRETWLYAYTAAVLGAFCGMRGCEIKKLKWKDVDFAARVLDIRHSKTPAGWRAPTLNTVCKEALAALKAKAVLIHAASPEHFCFPSQLKGKIDATRPITSWRTAWRSLRTKAARNDEGEIIYPALEGLRFHDLRHTAVTVMAEAGLPDATIMAQVGHISPQMLKTYSHVRRLALNAAAAALEPTYIKPQIHAELVN
ncbi:MAG: tyrosine-type recombinase/integrase [Pyrinomonadaceae bacterium]|nr:tyrosine-type recombinase/integrase [Pyrinomonadaceae bacterium]